MELIKSKGLVVFLVVLLTFTVLNSISIKKYDEKRLNEKESYMYIEKETSIIS